jgi:hypothetical protein
MSPGGKCTLVIFFELLHIYRCSSQLLIAALPLLSRDGCESRFPIADQLTIGIANQFLKRLVHEVFQQRSLLSRWAVCDFAGCGQSLQHKIQSGLDATGEAGPCRISEVITATRIEGKRCGTDAHNSHGAGGSATCSESQQDEPGK